MKSHLSCSGIEERGGGGGVRGPLSLPVIRSGEGGKGQPMLPGITWNLDSPIQFPSVPIFASIHGPPGNDRKKYSELGTGSVVEP
jgi:hypothetical protein